MDATLTQGRSGFCAELKIIDDQGNDLPMDGKAAGNLCIRGWGIARDYLKGVSRKEFLDGGWFDTGDVATINKDGYLRITDRAKDMIKSGGEWISSIELENVAMGHPAVAEAAVIGIEHSKWGERPLLVVVRQDGAELTAEEILSWLDGKVANWWKPDAVEFIESLPHTATGKFNKLALREIFNDYRFAKDC